MANREIQRATRLEAGALFVPRFCAEDNCPNAVEPGEHLCPRCGEIEERRMGWRTLIDGASFFVLVFAVLMLGGCGSEVEPDVRPAPPRDSAEYQRPPAPTVHEVCTVTLHDDGTVSCSCEVAR